MTTMLTIKICGVTTNDAVISCIKNRVDNIGMVFHPQSPRNVNLDFAEILAGNIPSGISKTALVVNPSMQFLRDIDKAVNPNFFQLNGAPSIEKLKEIKDNFSQKIIQTIYIESEKDLLMTDDFVDCVDAFLFEAKPNNADFVDHPDNYFNWQILTKKEIKKPWFLSGGLSRFNVKSAIRSSGALAVNASTTLEVSPGIKDPKLIEEFVNSARASVMNI